MPFPRELVIVFTERSDASHLSLVFSYAELLDKLRQQMSTLSTCCWSLDCSFPAGKGLTWMIQDPYAFHELV